MGEKRAGLTSREKLFCQNYVRTGNIREAAARSGFALFPEKNGMKLIHDERIQEEIARLHRWNRQRAAYSKTVTGYERLAYGGVSDAVRLLFSETVSPEELEDMDLFNVAEIKRPRDGCLEIKFFDRLKALEKLEQMSSAENEGPSAFLAALEQGARAISQAGGSNEV